MRGAGAVPGTRAQVHGCMGARVRGCMRAWCTGVPRRTWRLVLGTRHSALHLAPRTPHCTSHSAPRTPHRSRISSPVTTIIYAVAKLLAYSAWCYVGLRVVNPTQAHARVSLSFGALRWLIGLAFGIALFFAIGSIDAEAAARTYFLVYSPVRVVEWGIIAFAIATRAAAESRTVAMRRLLLWCVGGVLVSFATDLLSPEGLQGRFCVGRCLC